MTQTVKVIYQHGAFVPLEPLHLPENTEIEITIRDPLIIPSTISDPSKKLDVMRDLIRSMQKNPIPSNAPKFTRDELHERR